MSFVVPTFNILCNVKTCPVPNVPSVPVAPFRLTNQPCQLTYGRRVNTMSTGGTGFAGVLSQGINLLLPAGTDVRGPQDTVSIDMVEVPAGTGRWYAVFFVDDIGKSFANEHRTAGLQALMGSWVAPYL